MENCKNCFVLYETDWFISESTVVRSDIAIICGELKEKIEDPPKVVIEIVSPNSIEGDEKLKFELYEREGVDYYILVYPEMRKLKVYKRTPKGFSLEKEKLHLESCEIEIGKLKEVFKMV